MKRITCSTALVFLLCLPDPSLATETPKPRRTTISLLANGKEIASLVLLPGQGNARSTSMLSSRIGRLRVSVPVVMCS
jgi:hypothetical protein